MRQAFKSLLSERLYEFVQYKQSLGYAYDTGIKKLKMFDRFCENRFPNGSDLTKEICLAWAIKRESEKNNTFLVRISPVREFGKYLISLGEDAYVLSDRFCKKSARPTPHIYSEDEIASIWAELDNLRPCSQFPCWHIVAPAFIRLLYCCGLRPVEAQRLSVDDVDLTVGKLSIRESKGNKDRIVMIADDVCDYLRDYNIKIKAILPGREWFFPTLVDKPFTADAASRIFLKTRKRLSFDEKCSTPARLYDFRHTFATHRFYQWLREGKELTSMLPYLSAYMGHEQLSDTCYYIHLVPGQLETMSGLDFSRYESLLPEVAR